MAHSPIFTEEDFLAAYDAHADEVFRHCHLQIADRSLSMELMTEAFRDLWLFAAKGNAVDNVKIFLFRSLNRHIELLQEERRAELMKAPSDGIVGASLGFLRELSPADRRVCILHHIDGFSTSEIGAIIGGSAKTHGNTLKEIGNRFAFLTPHVA